MPKLSNTTKIAIQAAVAVGIAVIIGWIFKLERSYWAILTALILISQTWGESIKKSFERVLMTILGGIVGTLIFFLLHGRLEWQFVMILISAFFMVYFLNYSYLLTVFFITIFVVFLFAILRGWTIQYLNERIYETIIGAGIAIFTSAFVFPIKESGGLQNILVEYIKRTEKFIDSVFSVIFGRLENKITFQERRESFTDYINIKNKIKTMSYEMFFTYFSRQKLKKIVILLGTLLHYVTSMIDISPKLNNEKIRFLIEAEFNEAHEILTNNLKFIQELFLNKKSRLDFISLKDTLDHAQQKIANHIKDSGNEQSMWFDTFSFFYFMKKTNEVLRAIKEEAE